MFNFLRTTSYSLVKVMFFFTLTHSLNCIGDENEGKNHVQIKNKILERIELVIKMN